MNEPVKPCRPGASSLSAARFRELARDWQAKLKQLHVPGFSVAVVCGDRIAYTAGFGESGPPAHKKISSDSLFYLASSTKSLTAVAAAQLAAQGKLDLQAPVKLYLPRFKLADPQATETVTVEDLLSHRRGLTDIPIMVGEALTGEMNDDRFYRLLANVKPREKFVYSNLHYTILQRVLEKVTGKPWPQVLREEVFKPLGMYHTTASYRAMVSDPHYAGMVEEVNGQWIPTRTPKHDEVMNAAGGVASTAPDLARLLLAMLNDGKINGHQALRPGLAAREIEPRVQLESSYQLFQRTGYGYGWYDGTYQGRRAVHHFGSYEGAHAHLSFMPEEGIGVVVLVNMHEPVNYFAEAVAGSVYDSLLGLPDDQNWQMTVAAAEKARSKPERVPHDGGTAEWAGDFVNDDWGTLHLVWQKGALHAKLGVAELPMDFQSDEEFITSILGNPVKGHFAGQNGKKVVILNVPHGPAIFARRP